MILLLALLVGLLIGLAKARWLARSYSFPPLRCTWLALVGFLPQLLTFYLPATRDHVPDTWAAASLVVSQVVLLAFVWLNRHLPGMWVMFLGLALNLAVITANGGFMPIGPQAARQIIPASVLESIQPGSRFGHGKDIFLLPENTCLPWLSDGLLLPHWSPYQVAFSPGDVLIALGVFWLLTNPEPQIKQQLKLVNKGAQ